ncbi:hypothetical protein HDU97_010191, partial [Phlyctochytrium planicorne]
MILCCRTPTSWLSIILHLIWFTYITITVLDLWTKRTTGPLGESYARYATNLATIFYTLVLVSVVHLSMIRTLALIPMGAARKKIVQALCWMFLVCVFLLRMARTGVLIGKAVEYAKVGIVDDGRGDANDQIVRLGAVAAALQ